MKLLYIILAACLSVASVASADSYSGSMRSTALPSILDYNGDGITGRDFSLATINDGHFDAIEGSVDSGLFALPRVHPDWVEGTNSCPLDTDFELTIDGTIVFAAKKSKSAVFLVPDTSVHLCFTPGNEEVVELFITGAVDDNGGFVWAYGTAQIRLRDIVLKVNATTGFPEIVWTTGDYDLNVFYD